MTKKAQSKKGLPSHYTVIDLAQMIERSEQTVYLYIKKNKIKPNKAGLYPLAKIKEAFDDAKANDNKTKSIDPAKAKKIDLECQILQAKLNQINGVTIDKNEHLQILLRSNQIIKQKLLSKAKEIQQTSNNVELIDEVKRIIAEICNEMALAFAQENMNEQNEQVETIQDELKPIEPVEKGVNESQS